MEAENHHFEKEDMKIYNLPNLQLLEVPSELSNKVCIYCLIYYMHMFRGVSLEVNHHLKRNGGSLQMVI